MKTGGKSLKFWGESFLEGIGISAACAAVLAVIQVGRGDFSEGIVGLALEVLSLYPYYLFLAGVFVMLMEVIGYFQAVFSILVSMNATRKSVARGITGSVGATILGLIIMAAVIWMLVPGDISEAGLKLLPLLTGILCIMTAVFLIFGGVSVKWGKTGKIIMTIFCVCMGAIAGFTFAMNGDPELVELLMKLAKGNFVPVMVIGIVLFLASGIFVEIMTRKMEVRV